MPPSPTAAKVMGKEAKAFFKEAIANKADETKRSDRSKTYANKTKTHNRSKGVQSYAKNAAKKAKVMQNAEFAA